MLFTRSNVQAKLAGSRAEADTIIFGCGAAPCFTLVVNAGRHPSIDAFLRAAGPALRAFAAAGSTHGRMDATGLPAGPISVARYAIGTGGDLSQWDELDAVLMADTFAKLADVLDEVADSST